MNLSSNVNGDYNDETNLSLTDRQVLRLHKAFAKNSPANITSKTQLFKMVQLRWFLGKFFGLLLKTDLPLMKNVLKPLAEIILIPLGLTAATAAGTRIHKKS